MKIRHLLGMAVLGLMAAACSNDVNDVLAPEAPQKVMHLIATIAPKTFDATTRALVDNENGTLSASWEEKEKIRISYSDTYVDAEVTEVAADGSATIKATFNPIPTDGTQAYLDYPAGSVYSEQDGTLANRDIRQGTVTLNVGENKVTFDGQATLKPLFGIVGFTLTDVTKNDALFVNKMVISFDSEFGPITIVPTDLSNADYLYVSMPPLTNTEVWFEATSKDGDPFIAKGTANLEAGKFYQTEVKMYTVGNVIGSDGKFYVDQSAIPEGNTASALIAYIGADNGEASPYNHGLAIALVDCGGDIDNDGPSYKYKTSTDSPDHEYRTKDSNEFRSVPESGLHYRDDTHNSDTYPAFKAAFANNGTASPIGCSYWFLPTAYQWHKMINGFGGGTTGGQNLRSAFESKGGRNMITGDKNGYQTSTESAEDGTAWRYNDWIYFNYNWKTNTANGAHVRSVIAF